MKSSVRAAKIFDFVAAFHAARLAKAKLARLIELSLIRYFHIVLIYLLISHFLFSYTINRSIILSALPGYKKLKFSSKLQIILLNKISLHLIGVKSTVSIYSMYNCD